MKKIILSLLLFSVALSQQQHLTILHWNDFHSQNIPYPVKVKNKITNTDTSFLVGGYATLAAYIHKHSQDPKSTLVLNAGDDFQGSPVSSITKGNSQIQILNIIHPDAFTIGNHEFDYGRNQLEENLKFATFPVISANLYDIITQTRFAKPYLIKQIGNSKVAIIGLITTSLSTLTLPSNINGLEVKSLPQTVNSLIPELKKQKVDLIIALTHQGVDEDSILALQSPDLDIIVGGHSHTPLFKPKYVNGILIAQAGTKGRWLGKIDVTIDLAKDTILSSTSELVECRAADIKADSNVELKVNELEKLADQNLNEVIAELKTDWLRSGRNESNIGDWMTDAFRTYAKTNIAFQNSGGIRKEVLAGRLTVRDFWEISPFGNTLVTFNVNGLTLQSMINYQVTMGEDICQISGLSYTYSRKDNSRFLRNILVNNEPVDPQKIYSIATNNYVASQSKKYFGIQLSDVEINQLNVIDRDVLIDAAKEQKIISSQTEGRIKEIQ